MRQGHSSFSGCPVGGRGFSEALSPAPVSESGLDETDLIDILLRRARHTPRDLAYAFLEGGESESVRLDYGQLADRVLSIAAAMQSRWLPGNRVILLYPPGLEYVCAFLACVAAGLAAVPAYPPARRQSQRLNAIVRDADPIAVLTNAEIHGRLERMKDLSELLALDRLITDAAELPDPGQWKPRPVRPSDLAFLQYTSGSTGSPKGVMISHANLMANQRAIKAAFGHDHNSTVVGWLPLYHDMGLIGNVLQPLYCGAAAILMPPMAFFEQPIRWLRAIHHYRAHSSGGPDFAYDLCARSIRPEQSAALDLSCWKVAFNGSEPIRARTLERFNAAFAANHFQPRSWLPCYGLAESTLFVSGAWKSQPPVTTNFDAEALAQGFARIADDPGTKPLVGCGRVESPLAVQIVDPDRCLPVSEHRVGEICLSGPSVAQGYWGKDEATRETFGLRLNESEGRRWLRTGDLGFVYQDQLYVCGRLKDLIIIRGRNLYPQDIESALQNQITEIRPGGVAAFAIEDPDGEKLVVVTELQRTALKHAPDGRIEAAIRRLIAEQFESEARLVLVRPGAIPKTSSGKLRRSACRQMLLDGSLAGCSAGSPRSSRSAQAEAGQQNLIRLRNALADLPPEQREPLIRAYLAGCLARLLQLPETAIDLDLSPHSLGLASLQALEVKHAADRLIASDLALPDWLGEDSLTVLARRLARGNPVGLPSSETLASNPQVPGPLSETQKAIWAVHHHDPSGTAYNLHFACRFQEALEPERFLRALDDILRKHPILRTVYREDSDGRVHQIVAEKVHPEACCRWIEALDWSEADVQNDFARRIGKAFDLEHGPVFRIDVYPRASGHTVMLAAGHHIAFDFWSLSLLLRDLECAYGREAGGGEALEANRAGYPEFVEWQKNYLESSGAEKAWSYWRRQLGGDLPLLDLACDFPAASTPSHHGASVALRLDRDLGDALIRLASRHKVSLFTLLLAAYKVLLFRHCGQPDLIVGVPFHGRGESRFSEVIGNFVNPLALRTRPRSDQPFSGYLQAVASTVREALEVADFPFPVLVERLRPVREAGRWPIYQTWFVLQQTPSEGACGQAHLALAENGGVWRLGAWRIESLSIRERIENFDLKLMAAPDAEGWLFSFQYRRERFRRETIERLASRFQGLLRQIVTQEHCVLGDLEWLDPSERQQLQRWNETRVVYPFEGWVHQHVERRAQWTPNATAVAFGKQRLGYADFNARANQIAHGLIACGVRADSVVAVCARRSLELVPALHGILKAGAAYLPLDPDLPEDRLRRMIEESRPSCLLLQIGLESLLGTLTIPTLTLDSGFSAFAARPRHNPDTRIHGGQAAYLIYTSGSTGQPKGVVVPHHGLLNRLLWMQEVFQLQSGDCVLQKTPYAFDVSVWEFFWPLMAGASLVVEQPDAHRDPQHLIASIETYRITCLHFVPSMLRAFLEAPGLDRCSGLRWIVSSGEALDAGLAALAVERLPADLYNLYGPTEASIDVTFWNYQKGSPDAKVPIGRPIANTRIHVLDTRLNPVPPGCTGELYIGGIGLARGYIARPDLSAERFLPDPYSEEPGQRMYRTGDLARQRPDGAIEYLGRNDFQVKIRGYRIELGEIEVCLSRHPAIASALVQAVGDPGEQKLIAYAIPARKPPDIEALRGYLKQSLADYMIPAAFVFLDRWPLSANGKLDRRHLPAPDPARASDAYAAPRNHVESLLAGIWGAVLRLERIGIHDNFFALGGDSILSIQVAGRAHGQGLRFAPKDVFQYQSIAALAPHVQIIEAGEASRNAAVAAIPNGPIPLTPIQIWFFQREWVNPHHWNQALLLKPDPELDPEALASALQRVIDRHPVFRLRFRRTHGEWQAFSLDSADGALAVAREDLSRAGAAPIRERCECWQSRLDLEHGPLLNAVWFDPGPNQDPRLLLIAHHLVVDALSWTILLDDLQQAWRNGPEAALPPAGSAYQTWSLRLAEHCAALETPAPEPCRAEDFPLDDPHGSFLETDTEEQRFELNAELSQFLLQQAPRLLHAGVQEILLAALFEAVMETSGIRHLEIDIESHGREHSFPDIDLSRSVGWFTRLIKVFVSGNGPDGALRRIKQQVRPRLAEFKVQTGRSSHRNAPVLFNYLGQLDLPGHLPFALDESPGNPRDPRNPRSHEWEINAAFRGGCLTLDWNFSRLRYWRTGILALGQTLIEKLEQILRSASEEGPTCLSPSDFPLAGLDVQELDALPLRAGEIEDIYPLGAMQEGLLFHTLAHPGSGIYVMQDRYQIEGQIDESLFCAAWQRVVEDHAILRSGFLWDSGRRALHLVRRGADSGCEILDWRECPEQDQNLRLRRMLDQELKQGFDLGRPPLLRIRLLRLTQTRYCLLRSFHHIIMDAWCTSLLLEGFMAHYLALRSGAPRPACCVPAFRDYIAWLKSCDHAAAERFWEDYLAGFRDPTPIRFASRPGPVSIQAFGPESRVADRSTLLSEAESDFLQSRAQAAGLTLNTLVQAAWALLLRTLSGRREVLFGVTVAGRPTELAGIEATLGLFINSLPLRIDLRPEQRVESWLHALQEQNLKVRQFEFTPLSRIQALSGIPRGQALFDSLLVFENTPIDPALRDGSQELAVVGAQSRTHTNYPLTAVIIPDRRLCLQITYQVDRYESDEITRMLEQFKHGLMQMLQRQNARLADLDPLPEAERERWLKQWNRRP
ncbi:MAG: amino acid adenylation domain-containing protein, partial [Methylococcaceae bacterium]|nr:amino acid adenylation domain-containing protein [Methylococcaceae bacterium]